MKSICNQLLHDHAKGRRSLESIKLIWTERDPVLMKNVDGLNRHIVVPSADFVEECHKE